MKMSKNKNFLLLSIGGFISSIGDYLYNIGLLVYLYSVTRSVGTVALMWLSRGLLRIPVQYIAGVLADRYNKKRIIVITNLLSVPVALSLLLVNEKNLWISYLIAFLLQSLDDIDVCSENAILPQLVDKSELSYANSIFSFLSSTCFFIAPAIGGLIYKAYGSNVLFTINAISFLVSGSLFSLIKYSFTVNKEKMSEKNIFADGIEGFQLLKDFINVKTVFLVMTACAVMGRLYETYKVAMADNFLHLKPEGIIYFDYALAIGGLLVPLFIRSLSKYKEVSLFVISTFFISIAYIGFGYSHRSIVTLGILVLLGTLQNLQGIYSRTIIQKSIPIEYIGRVFSFYKIVLTLFALIGIGIATPLYNSIGVSNSFLAVGVVVVFLCILYFVKSRNIKTPLVTLLRNNKSGNS